MLCVLCCVPAAVVEGRFAHIAQASLFLMVGLAVMLFIMAGMRQGAYDRLLGNAARGSEVDAKCYTPTGQKVLSVYWSTITCLYFCKYRSNIRTAICYYYCRRVCRTFFDDCINRQ